MDGSRFDTWTRRRFGLAAGGFAATLLGLVRLDEAESKNSKPKHNKPKKAKKCKKLGTGCNPGNQTCCSVNNVSVSCAPVAGLGGNRCCYTTTGTTCTSDDQCCGSNRCTGPEGARTCQTP